MPEQLPQFFIVNALEVAGVLPELAKSIVSE
jgi:hypothetical protein